MRRVLLSLCLIMSSAVFAENVCELAVGNWQGWVKMGGIMKLKGTGSAMHLTGDDYLISGEIPDLGINETYQETCINGVIKVKELKHPIYLKHVGNKIIVDYEEDLAVAHFEHTISIFDQFKDFLGLN